VSRAPHHPLNAAHPDYFTSKTAAAHRFAEQLAARPGFRGRAFNFSNEMALMFSRWCSGSWRRWISPSRNPERGTHEIRRQKRSAAVHAPSWAGGALRPRRRSSGHDHVVPAAPVGVMASRRAGRGDGASSPSSPGSDAVANALLTAAQLNEPEPRFPLDSPLFRL
jgi:hypothetical protein